MQGGMYHKGLYHVHDCLDGSLSTYILVLSTNPWERLTLSFLVTITMVFLIRENTIITMLMFDFGDTLIPQPLFETCLTHDHFNGTSLMLCHYMVPPWKRRSCDSRPYQVGKHSGVSQMNWSIETKSPTSYWSLVIAPSRSSSGWVRKTVSEHFFTRAQEHNWQGGTMQFLAEGFFGWIIAGRIVVLPSGSS